MSATMTRAKLKRRSRSTWAHIGGNHTRRAATAIRHNYRGMTSLVGRKMQRARNAVRRRPGTSAALAIAGLGLLAGLLVSMIYRSRLANRQIAIWPY